MEYLEIRIGLLESILGGNLNDNINHKINILSTDFYNSIKSINSIKKFIDEFDSNDKILIGGEGTADDSLSKQDKLTLIDLFDKDILQLDTNLRQIELLSEFKGDLNNLVGQSWNIQDLNTQLNQLLTQSQHLELAIYRLVAKYNDMTNTTSNKFIDINNNLNILDLHLKRLEFNHKQD